MVRPHLPSLPLTPSLTLLVLDSHRISRSQFATSLQTIFSFLPPLSTSFGQAKRARHYTRSARRELPRIISISLRSAGAGVVTLFELHTTGRFVEREKSNKFRLQAMLTGNAS
jgi:hypothetical protein